jgi:pyruvate kinase
VARQLHLHRGIFPIYYRGDTDPEWSKDVDHRIEYSLRISEACKILVLDKPIVLVTGWRPGSGATNSIRIVHFKSKEEPMSPEI